MTDQSPATHADDIVRLIESLSPDGAPAALFAAVREAFRRDGVAAAMATVAAGLAPEEGEAAPGPERAAAGSEQSAAAEETPTPEQTTGQAVAGEQAPTPEQAATFRRMHANLPVFLTEHPRAFAARLRDVLAAT
ncbi:hypothetical protein [Streptomyces cyaneofuscatus]